MPASSLTELTPSRRAGLKVSYTARALDGRRPTHVLAGPDVRPRPGDLVVATVTEIGRHTRLESAQGRRRHLFPGDEVLVAYGARYAPDQFEAEAPTDLGPCDLVAAGGIAGLVSTAHEDVPEPTRLLPIGLAADAEGRRTTMADLAAPAPPAPLHGVPTIAVVGTSMNAGKTTSVAHLVRGLAAAGYRVGAAKVTGTGAGGDRWMFHDAGADTVLDFTDDGLATTYRVPVERVARGAAALHDRLTAAGAQAVVLEVADGLMQPETAALLRDGALRSRVDGWVFAAGDAAGALYGRERLRTAGLPVVGVAGRFTASPLAAREAGGLLDVPVLSRDELADAAVAAGLTARPLVGAVQGRTA
ncbi:DUF1611 domain-containing protein [Nocardiopsis sp. RSe5-2]|uniref:DUF1611 domain-containing protein n=1 Tax=Nocardiopsis endophytica TaxID=3018445 RepID=A0ABT4UF53_9ACTN|nr:DUF1611 domain-containing protein [Nocardiopsis endophytica]MDA2815119.1 DUF1611 domain-containing protein [Nocardiopsis endophytica]